MISKVHLEVPEHYVKAHSESLESKMLKKAAGGQTVSRSFKELLIDQRPAEIMKASQRYEDRYTQLANSKKRRTGVTDRPDPVCRGKPDRKKSKGV